MNDLCKIRKKMDYTIKWRKQDGSITIEEFVNLSDVAVRMKALSKDKIEYQVIVRR